MNARLQTWKPYCMGVQISFGVDDKYCYEVLAGDVGLRCRELLRKRYWGQHLWARGYWVVSSGNVTDEVWREYIQNQKPPEQDNDF